MIVRYCKVCGEQIHPKRLEIIPTATTCVPCSTTEKKGVVTVMKGQGDHTWVETIFLEPDVYKKYVEQEGKLKNEVKKAVQRHADSIMPKSSNHAEGLQGNSKMLQDLSGKIKKR